MPSSTVEQYLKTIFLIQRRSGVVWVPMKVLADAMGVAPGTATAMAKHLQSEGLIDYVPRRGTVLSEDGRRLALRVVRRHRLIETFLEQVLAYDWSEVHSDAEELEHVVSDRFVERIDSLLGFPELDPHGDPIPRADGHITSRDLVSLSEADSDSVTVARLVEDGEVFLQFMKDNGIVPGAQLRVTGGSAAAGTIELSVQARGTQLTLSRETAASVLVLVAPTDPPR